MPIPKHGESRDAYVARCIHQVSHEAGAGKSKKDHAAHVGKCEGMYDYYTKRKKHIHHILSKK